jgi:hypothetical protein
MQSEDRNTQCKIQQNTKGNNTIHCGCKHQVGNLSKTDRRHTAYTHTHTHTHTQTNNKVNDSDAMKKINTVSDDIIIASATMLAMTIIKQIWK